MCQNNLREELKSIIIEKGIKLKFVSEKSGVYYTSISKWLHNKRDFSESNLDKLKKFVKEHGQR